MGVTFFFEIFSITPFFKYSFINKLKLFLFVNLKIDFLPLNSPRNISDVSPSLIFLKMLKLKPLSFKMISNDKDFDLNNTLSIFEITLSNLLSGKSDINEQDFLDRAELLCSSGKTVMITNFQEYYKLSDYFSKYSDKKRVLTMGVDNLIKVFDESYYNSLSGGILEAFGKLFKKNTEVYLLSLIHI